MVGEVTVMGGLIVDMNQLSYSIFWAHWVSCSVLKSRSDKKDVFRSNYIGLTVGTDAYKGPCTSALVQKKNACKQPIHIVLLQPIIIQYHVVDVDSIDSIRRR